MDFCLAPISTLTCTKSHCKLSTAGVSPNIWPKNVEEWLFRMKHAVIKLSSCKGFTTSFAFVNLQSCPKLPKYSSPAHRILLQKLYESLQVPTSIRLVLSNLSSIYIYKNSILLKIRTSHPCHLFISVKLIAIHTEIERIGLIIDQIIKFVHENLRLKAISRIFKVVKISKRDELWNLLHRFCWNVTHINRNIDHVIEVLRYEKSAIVYKRAHQQIVSRHENRNDILNTQNRLFLSYEFHQPFEDIKITLNSNVYVLARLIESQLRVKILHLCKQNFLFTYVVFLQILSVVLNVYDDAFFVLNSIISLDFVLLLSHGAGRFIVKRSVIYFWVLHAASRLWDMLSNRMSG